MGLFSKWIMPSSAKINVELRITIAMLRKLTLIKSVASSRFGALISLIIFSSVFVPDVFSSSISVGLREKNADSAAETKATTTNKLTKDNAAKKVLIENDLIIILLSGKLYKRCMVLWTGNVVCFG